MIRATIELIPGGLEIGKITLGTLEIRNNMTGTWEIGNYDYKLTGYDGDEICGYVGGFPRNEHGKAGSLALIKTVLADILE